MASATKSILSAVSAQSIPVLDKSTQPLYLSRGPSCLSAGLLLGFAAAYIAHAPLTMGRVAIIAAFGILFLANSLASPKRTLKGANPCI
jgi:hypothetical protein